MTDEEKAAEARAQATALEAKKKEDEANAKSPEQIRIETLEKEKQEILVREANYKVAYLKEVRKNEGTATEETEEDKIRRIYREEQTRDRLNQIDTETKSLLEKALKENRELRLAAQNRPAHFATGGGSSTEQPVVVSTLVTPEQIAAFKARGWSDKDIERYKKNLSKNSR